LSFPSTTPTSDEPLVIGLAPDQSKLYIAQDQYVAILNTLNDDVAGRIELAQMNVIHTGADPSKVYFSTKNYVISTVDVISNTIINTISIKD